MNFKRGDQLVIRAYKCEPGKGLSYPAMTLTASEDGSSGGWDVYNGTTVDGKEVSFYGFSVEEVYM